MLPILVQLAGAAAAMAGVYLLAGLGVSLLVAGAALMGVGTLAELRRPAPRRVAGDDERYTS